MGIDQDILILYGLSRVCVGLDRPDPFNCVLRDLKLIKDYKHTN
jgi:hypothetical protein